MTKTSKKYSPEVRARAAQMVLSGISEHGSRWAAIVAIVGKIGCVPQTLNEWVKQVETDTGKRGGLTTEERDRVKALEREVKELRQANEILHKASALPLSLEPMA